MSLGRGSNKRSRFTQLLTLELSWCQFFPCSPAMRCAAPASPSTLHAATPRRCNMPKKAAPFKQAPSCAMRPRVHGDYFYVSEEPGAAAAEKAMAAKVAARAEMGVPQGLGPNRTTVAQALMNY